MKVRLPTEEAEQAAVALWLNARRVLYCAVPNGGFRHMRTAAMLKRTGVKAGVPDLLIFNRPPARPEAVGVALEMKRVGVKKASPVQQEWLAALQERGWLCAVQPGAAAAISWLTDLGF